MDDSVTFKHLDLVLQYLHKAFETEMQKFAIYIKSSAEPVANYESLDYLTSCESSLQRISALRKVLPSQSSPMSRNNGVGREET